MGVGSTDAPPPEGPARGSSAREPSLADLQALATHAQQRLALYRRKFLLGRGEPQRLAELERVSTGAAQRVRRARDRHNAGQ
jgi:hypothetical protein